MKHFASPEFWGFYKALPPFVQGLADRSFMLLKNDPRYPSLHLKKTGRYWSVRIGLHYRAVAVEVADGLLWFWIGSNTIKTTATGNKKINPTGDNTGLVSALCLRQRVIYFVSCI